MPAIRRWMLQDAVDRSEPCPGAGCPFWEEGGAVLDGGCFLERILPFEDWTPELAQKWLRVRARLAGKADGWPLFYLLGERPRPRRVDGAAFTIHVTRKERE